MDPLSLDQVDRGILHMLQLDARNHVASTIAEEVGVSPNTVRNRIKKLERARVIEGYQPQIDYEQAGYQLHAVFVCTAPISSRRTYATEALQIAGVVEVSEILSGQRNISIKAVGEVSDDITEIAQQIEAIGLAIRDERFLKNVRTQPFAHFAPERHGN